MQPLDDANERLVARLVAGELPQRRGEHAGAARRLQRRAAARHAVLHRAGPGPAPACGLQGAARRERLRRASRARASATSTTSCAISAWAARSCRRREKARFLAIQEELAQLAARFQDNLLDATNAFGLYVTDEHELSGIPADVVQAAREAARARGSRAGAKLTLHMPCYLPGDAVRGPPRPARAHVPRLRDPRLRARPARTGTTAPLIARILELRAEAARLLGYRSLRRGLARHQDGRLARARCSPSSTTSRAARGPFAERDMAELAEFARARARHGRSARLGRGLRGARSCASARYAFSDQEVKQYFPENEVLAGMFRLVETLYGVRIRRGRGRDLASRRALLRDRRRGRRAASASSTSTSTRARASAAAPGWTTR